MQTSPLIIWQWSQSHCQLFYLSGRLSLQVATTALQATTFKSLAQLDRNGWHKLLERTTHFSCLECNWSHWRSIHIALLPIFHLLMSALLSSKHQMWHSKACTTNHTNHAEHDRVHATAYIILVTIITSNYACMHANMQNPILQLTSVLWWLVTVKVIKSRLNGRYTKLIHNQHTAEIM